MQAERERSASIVQVRLLGATIFSGGSPAPLSSGTHTPVTSVEIRGTRIILPNPAKSPPVDNDL